MHITTALLVNTGTLVPNSQAPLHMHASLRGLPGSVLGCSDVAKSSMLCKQVMTRHCAVQDTMTLLTNHGMVPNSRAQLRMHASLPGGLPSMPGVPGLSWDDPMRYPFTASAPAKFGGQPGSPSTAYLAQVGTIGSASGQRIHCAK